MRVVAVHAHPSHAFSKAPRESIRLVEGLGVEGDSHAGVTVQHRSRVAKDPSQPNLRQVHLMHQELLEELRRGGLAVMPGEMGENITTKGLDLLALSEGTVLRIGETALVRITGLRNPCAQIDAFKPGLLAAVLGRTSEGELIRKAGVMGVVVTTGEVKPGDALLVQDAPPLFKALKPV